MRGLTALGKTEWDMPVGYDRLRLKMSMQGLDHENMVNILENKINVLGGMNYISVDNINKANKNRADSFNRFIAVSYPYVKVAKDGESEKGGGLDKLIKDYYKIFGKPNQNGSDTQTNTPNLQGPNPSIPPIHCRANDGVPRPQLP